MIIKTMQSAQELHQEIFKQQLFGAPKYTAKLEGNSIFYVYEQYTFRNGNYMTISVLLEDKETHRLIHFIPSGASRGLLGFTLGANASRETMLLKLLDLNNYQYEIIEE